MSNLQTEIKEWVLKPRKDDWQRIFVTEDQAKYILNAWKRTPNAELYDKLTGRLVEVVSRTDYRLRRIDVEQRDSTGDVWICDCGRRNPLNVWPPEKCECKGKGLLLKLQRQAEDEKRQLNQIAAIA